MRRYALAACALAIACLQTTLAQTPSASPSTRDRTKLPVRRVILYKNGVGYFEHVGKVHGSETVAIDFNSGQLNDVLKSLTTLDLGNGRVTGVSYNSEAPLAQRLGALRLPIGEHTTLAQLLDALRGARLEVRAGDRIVTGRLLSVESRTRGRGEDAAERDEITLVSDAGDVRIVEITPAVTVKLAEHDTTEQVGAYLGILGSTRAQDRRRLSIATAGNGERDLLVSYISEVPVWKTSYRIVLPSRAGTKPILQGWAIVDNTIGEDWSNVELSLVAGAPQSFIQQLSQPLFARRPIVPLPAGVVATPQTHGATLLPGGGRVSGRVVDAHGIALPGVTVRAVDPAGRTVAQTSSDEHGDYSLAGLTAGQYQLAFDLAGFRPYRADAVTVSGTLDAAQDARMEVASASETVRVRRAETAVEGGRPGGVLGGVAGRLEAVPEPPGAPSYRDAVASAMQQIAPAADARELGDLFEYRISQPITIERNQSALVPILRADVTADRVSLWTGRSAGGRPLRALWLTNASGLTLDAGSFTVIDGETFAGEGLVDGMKPGEKRLLSYAVDLGVQVEPRNGDERRTVNRVTIARGVLTQHGEHVARRVYTVRNSDSTDRQVVIEHAIRAGWKLAEGVKPAESSADAYRFLLAVPAGQTERLTVTERQDLGASYTISDMNDQQLAIILRETSDSEAVRAALQPILAKKAALAAIVVDLASRTAELGRIDADQQRVRENMKALKGSSEEQQLVKRYASQLNQQEDQVAALRRELDDLQRKRQSADSDLARAIDQLTLDQAVGK